MISQAQQPSRVASPLSVSSVSESVSVTQARTVVYAGFMLGSPLPALHHPGPKGGFISGFIMYRESVTQIHASYRFSAVSQARPQAKDPVRALFNRTRANPACAILFGQTTTYRVTTVSVLYFSHVCRLSLEPARSRGVAPSPKPMPTQAPRPGAAVSLKPVESSKASDPFDWDKRPFDEMRHRYEVWNALGQDKPRVELSLKASPDVRKTVTPRKIDGKGLSFSAVDANGNVEEIPFSDVKSVRVLSA